MDRTDDPVEFLITRLELPDSSSRPKIKSWLGIGAIIFEANFPQTVTFFANSAFPETFKLPFTSIYTKPLKKDIPPCLRGCISRSCPKTFIEPSASIKSDPTKSCPPTDMSVTEDGPSAIRPCAKLAVVAFKLPIYTNCEDRV